MDTDDQLLIKRCNYTKDLVDEEDDVPLPGFRFHPLDEELVGFYLTRKVQKKPISLQLIKEIDIYKYDPWDLPKGNDSGEKEWYFFCKRGRKYRNSIRPNRVTGSGFWKATGIDRPIYSDHDLCIGLKKSLVYYRGSAGKGTKTEWMMHEFRLPPDHNNKNKSNTQEAAEVWTLCRILKRSPSYKKALPEWKEVSTRKAAPAPVVETSSGDSDYDRQSYISFQTPVTTDHNKPSAHDQHRLVSNHMSKPPSTTASCTSFSGLDMNDFIKHGDWGDLRSVVDQFCAGDPFFLM
ncbi:hypothetical protein R6Q57_009217 [Mikania cordata]